MTLKSMKLQGRQFASHLGYSVRLSLSKPFLITKRNKSYLSPVVILVKTVLLSILLFSCSSMDTNLSKAPDFTLKDSEGNAVSLKDYLGKPIVLYFYPKDNTPGCTKEACMFRDSYEEFQEAGAEVIGISNDSEKSHTGFKEKHSLPFILLSDPKGKVRKSYGVKSTWGIIPGRETFVIDKEGNIVHRFNSLTDINTHIEEALKVIKEME